MNKHSIPLTILISILTTATTLSFAFGSYQEKINNNVSDIVNLQNDLSIEREQRKDEYTQIRVDLAKIDVGIEYIKSAIDK